MFSLKDLTKVTKTSSGDLREKTKCAVNRVLIGKVLCPTLMLFQWLAQAKQTFFKM